MQESDDGRGLETPIQTKEPHLAGKFNPVINREHIKSFAAQARQDKLIAIHSSSIPKKFNSTEEYIGAVAVVMLEYVRAAPQAVTINDIFTHSQDTIVINYQSVLTFPTVVWVIRRMIRQKMLLIISTKPARYVIHPDAMRKFWEEA